MKKRKKRLKLYRQEGKFGIFQIFLPALSLKTMRQYFPVSYREAWFYGKNRFGIVFLQEDRMEAISRAFFKMAGKSFPPRWENIFRKIDKELTEFAYKISRQNLQNLSSKNLLFLYRKMFDLSQEMWKLSIFIDALDAGYDQKEIQKIAARHGFDVHEIQTLLTPESPSYVASWENALWRVKKGLIKPEAAAKRFFWYLTDYTDFGEVDANFIKKEARRAKPASFMSPEKEIKAILKKYNLKENPLKTFQILSSWRDNRKRLHFTGVYGLLRILREAARRQGTPVELADCIFVEEAEKVIKGRVIQKRELENRLKQGLFFNFDNKGHYRLMAKGKKAEIEMKKLEQYLPEHEGEELRGQVACKGFSRGRARIILDARDSSAKNLKEGDILITSMTRPEFLPLMKKSGAIVTNEGGISCHAAIVSRELNIPCVIGTKTATKFFKDGDFLEVDANRGIIKIVNRDNG